MTDSKKSERRSYDKEFIERLTVIDTRQQMVLAHLEKINGTIGDYPITKEKLNNACLKITELDADITEKLIPVVNNIKIKIWSVAAFVGVICGGIGSAVALVVQKLGGA
jgi:hypothetical protein